MRLIAWACVAMAAMVGTAFAAQPEPWGITFQNPTTQIMDQIVWFERYTLVIITGITLFVLGLLVWVVVRYRASRNPEPSKTTHNTMIEVVWTIVPVMILVAIAFPSFRLLYDQTTIPEPDMAVKAIGGQWYWNYEYMDEAHEGVPTITSYMLNEEDRAARMEEYGFTDNDAPRNLAVDYPLVVPEGAVVHMMVTSLDVNHAVAMPSFGIKADAIQGRLNETWFQASEPGVFYGQCSELCGRSHAFMPLEFRVLSQERFDEWLRLVQEDLDAATEQLLAWQAQDNGTPVASLDAD